MNSNKLDVYPHNFSEKIGYTEVRRGGAYFDPQSGYQFEVGTKYTLSNVLQLNLSAYHIRRNNEIAYTSIT